MNQQNSANFQAAITAAEIASSEIHKVVGSLRRFPRNDQPRIERNLSDFDAQHIAENVTSFFKILAESARATSLVRANDLGVASSSDAEEMWHDC